MSWFTMVPTTTNTTTTQNPWGPSQSGLTTALKGAQNAYNNTYNGPLVAEMDPNVLAGQNQQLGIAGQGQTSGAAQTGIGGVQNMLSQGGIGAPMQYGIDTLKSTVNNLNPVASGQYLQNNPYLDAIINATNQNVTNDVNANFSKAGRYGSGAYAGTLGTKLAQNESGMRYQNFMDQLNAMLGANNAIGGAANSVAGIGQQGISNVMNGGAALQNYQNPLYSDANQQKAVGGERMDYRQANIDAANQAPWTKVGNLAQIAQGIGSMGGTSNSQSTSWGPYQSQNMNPSSGQMAAGIGMSGMGMLGNMAQGGMFKNLFSSAPTMVTGALGSQAVPTFGAAAGTGLLDMLAAAAPAALSFLSDRRAKKDIQRIGTADNGLPIYAFNYKHGGPRQIGFMADEVEKLHPEAVSRDESGYMMVDYGKAAL